jgi:hypothetical protein
MARFHSITDALTGETVQVPFTPDEEAAADAAALAPPRYTIPKQLPFLRATDEEAELMEAAIANSGARLRNIYAGASYLDTADPLFPMLRTVLESIVGADRASELLEPDT